MSRPKGLPKTGGRKRGTKNRRTSRIVVEAAREGITPLEVQLRTMRMLWERAHRSSEPDLQLAKEACAVAAQCAPYCHPRLANVEARIDAVGRVEIVRDLDDGKLRLRRRPVTALPLLLRLRFRAVRARPPLASILVRGRTTLLELPRQRCELLLDRRLVGATGESELLGEHRDLCVKAPDLSVLNFGDGAEELGIGNAIEVDHRATLSHGERSRCDSICVDLAR